MQIIIFIRVSHRNVTMRFAAFPEPSPGTGNTGPMRLWIDVGRKGTQGRGGTNKIGGWVGPMAACDGNTTFYEYPAHGGA